MTKGAALLMAAGNSRRMGGANKLLMKLHHRPVIDFAVQAVLNAHLKLRILVTGRDADAVGAFGNGFEVVHNPRFAEGFGTSLAAGFSIFANKPEIEYALVMLADMPLITTAHLNQLTQAFAATNGNAIVRASYNLEPGNPVIIPKAQFANMSKLEGEKSGQAILTASGLPIILVEIGPAALADIDTPDALAALQEAVL